MNSDRTPVITMDELLVMREIKYIKDVLSTLEELPDMPLEKPEILKKKKSLSRMEKKSKYGRSFS